MSSLPSSPCIKPRSTCARPGKRNGDHPYVLGTQAYLDFLLGNRESALELLARAVEIGGEELPAAELETARESKLPVDDEFIEILQQMPNRRELPVQTPA